MIKKKRKRTMQVVGALVLADGAAALIFGPKYVSLFRLGRPANPYRRVIEWMLDRPSWQIRGAGAAEAGLGAAMLGQGCIPRKRIWEKWSW